MESIVNLEALLNEFYNIHTSNFRKRQIEIQLKEFQENYSSLQICLNNLQICLNNQFLFFFSVSTLELTITKKWFTIDKVLRTQIRDVLWLIYSSFPPNIGALQRDKLAQLIALIGKREFPENHAEFVSQILSLLKNKFVLGIILLKSTSYEICSTKIDCSHQQKSKFVQSMILCLNDIMTLLGKFLTLCVCHVNNNELVVGPEIDFDMHSSLPNDDKFVFCCTELLNTIASIFAWTPSNMETTMNVEFFNNIYELSTFTNEKYINIHLSAIMTICELFYLQKQIPKIQTQANGITELIQQKFLSQSPEEYQDKLTELLKLFIQQQWSRFIIQPEFPSKEFLLHLFGFTFTDNISALTFGERLSLWIPIIKSFDEKIAPRYTETIVQLVTNLILKMQFSLNFELLDQLDTEELDENMETELQTFRNNCIEVILTASEIEPCKICDLLNHEFTKENGHLKNYVNLLSTLPDISKDTAIKSRFNLNQIVRYSQDYLHCMCKDLTTVLQILSQTCNVILMITCDRHNSITNIIRTCILLLKLSNQKKMYLYEMDVQLKNDLVELQSQIISSVRQLMLLRTEIYENHEEIFELINSIMQVLLPSHFGLIEPQTVLNSASQLMTTITSVLRPNYFLKNPLVQELFHSDLSRYDEQIRFQVKMIVFNALLLPYSQIAVNLAEEQEYEKRGELLQQYVAFISYKFLSLDVANSYNIVRNEIKAELKDYEHLLNSYESTNNYSKQILLSAINPVIKKSIEIFQYVGKHDYSSTDEADLSMIINFNLSIVKCLQVQLGSEFVINIVRLFLEVASTPNRSAHVMNKLLEMLIFIVQHTGAISMQLMNDILKLTVDDLININPQIDISLNLFSLYDCILQNHWNYFQKNLSTTRNLQDDLMKIFNAYGQFLCNGSPVDPNIFRVILSSLEICNEKWHLYDKTFFVNSLLKSFMCTLLRLIVSLDGVLFYDQIITILFNMSEKNKTALHECLSVIFNDKTKILQLCEVTDLPTFANIMHILIQDSHVAGH